MCWGGGGVGRGANPGVGFFVRRGWNLPEGVGGLLVVVLLFSSLFIVSGLSSFFSVWGLVVGVFESPFGGWGWRGDAWFVISRWGEGIGVGGLIW